MTIQAASKNIFKLLMAVSIISFLAGCGGGGGGGPKKDLTPNAFTIAAVINAKVSTEVTSAPVTLSGFNQPVSISISGGSYSIGGGTFTSAAGTVTNGQVVTVKLTTSTKTSTSTTATLTVGGVSGQFTVTTEADVTPDAFTFTPVTGAGPKAVTTSNEITLAGVDVAVPVSIVDGEYSINGAAFTSAAGTINKDQKIVVRTTSSNKPATDVTTILTIGGITGSFVVTTKADEAAPTAQILFPPPVSMTEGNNILVRGSANDEFSPIAGVKVNGVLATTTDGFKNWQALVPLTDTTKPVTATTANTLTVTTEDAVGNKSINAAQVQITQATYSSAFPNAENSFEYITSVVIDRYEGRNRVLVNDYSKAIIAVDLANGERTIFSTIRGLDGLAVDPVEQHLYAVRASEDTVFFRFNLKDGATHSEYVKEYLFDSAPYALVINNNTTPAKIVSVSNKNGDIYSTTTDFLTLDPFSTSTIPDSKYTPSYSYDMAFDKANNRYLVPDVDQHKIFAVDATTGTRSIFSSNTVGVGEAFGEVINAKEAYLSGIQIDEKNQRAIVYESQTGKLFAIDLATGNRSLISSVTESNADNVVRHAFGLAVVSPDSYALVVADWNSLHGLFAIDLITGKRVIFSKSAGEFPY